MPVPCPPCRWPAGLDERGPADDPSILLTGRAHIGDIEVRVVAIRIDPERRGTPGYRSGVAAASYRAAGLDVALEAILEDFEYIGSDLEDLLGESRRSIVELATGPYIVLMVPWSFQG